MHTIIVHTWVSDEYIHFALIYKTDHILPVLTIKQLINNDIEPTMPQKLATITKPSVSNLRVLFCKCVVIKANAHFDTKAFKMCHQ